MRKVLNLIDLIETLSFIWVDKQTFVSNFIPLVVKSYELLTLQYYEFIIMQKFDLNTLLIPNQALLLFQLGHFLPFARNTSPNPLYI